MHYKRRLSSRFCPGLSIVLLLALTALAAPGYGKPFTVAVVRDGPSTDDKIVDLVERELRDLAGKKLEFEFSF